MTTMNLKEKKAIKATVTLRDLETLSGALLRLGQKELPIGLAFKVTMLLKAFEPSIQAFQEAHNELIARFAVVKHGQRIIETPNIPFYHAELSALHGTETTVEYEPIALDDLVDSGITITAVDLKALDMLLLVREGGKKDKSDA